MRRRLFNVLAALSLVLCVLWVALWVRSKDACDEVRYASPGERSWWGCGVSSLFGHVFIGGLRRDSGTPSAADSNEHGWGQFRVTSTRGNSRMWTWGVATSLQTVQYGHKLGPFTLLWRDRIRVDEDRETARWVMVPHWFLAAACAVAPAGWAVGAMRRWRGRRRRARGLCASCGYDLRATPGNCPECGAGDPNRLAVKS